MQESRKYSSLPKCVNVLEISDKREFLNSFDFIITDLEGVLYKHEEPLPGSAETVNMLRKLGKGIKLLVEDSRHTDEQIIDLLKDMDILDFKPGDIIHPLKILVRFIQRYKEGKSVFSLCTPETNDYLAKNTIFVNYVEPLATLTANTLQDHIEPKHKVASVIMDTNFNLTYSQLAVAQQYLMDPGCTLVVSSINEDVTIGQNFTTLGNSGFVQLLRDYATGPITMLCKPHPPLMEHVVAQFKVTDPQRVLFVGTNLITDMQFALKAEFLALLIESNAKDIDVLNKLPNESQPHYILNNFSDLKKVLNPLMAV